MGVHIALVLMKHIDADLATFLPAYDMNKYSHLCNKYLLNLIHISSLVGTKHQSHQDYLEKADKARSERLSSGPPSAK